MSTINIYVANHKKYAGISDLCLILINIFASYGFTVNVSNLLDSHASLNVIIDEFCIRKNNNYIKNFKINNPSSRLLLILTEFVSTRFIFRTFNLFNDVTGHFLRFLFTPLIMVYLKPFNLLNYILLLLVFFPLFLYIVFLLSFSKNSNYFTFLKSHFYLHLRFHGLIENINLFNYYASIHENCFYSLFSSISNINGLYLGQFFPIFKDSEINHFLSIERLKKCSKSIVLSGTITDYRKSYAFTLSELVKPDFEVFIYSFNSDVSKSENSLFSLNIPQSKSWQFFSPTRIYRAIIIDQNIPLVDFNFNQHPLEDLCFDIDLLKIKFNKNNFIYYSLSLEEIHKILTKKIYSYNSYASYKNSLLIFQLSQSKVFNFN